MKRQGFTLVELSIVLVIIGLLIGGILVAQSMIGTAKVQSVIREVQQYQIMVDNFGTKYGQLPGDSTLFTPNGNGNGIIWNNVYPYAPESPAFWTHLKLAGFLQNCVCDGGAPGDSGYASANTTTPQSSYAKGARWGVYNHQGVGGYFHLADPKSNYFIITSGDGLDSQQPANAIVKPANALAIDTKIDDGNPLTGQVLGTNDIGNGGFYDQYVGVMVTNLNCLNSTNPYANPAVLSSWSYNTAFTDDRYGCNMAFELKKNW